WSKAGQHERAAAVARKVLSSAPSRGLRLRCAGILLAAGASQAAALARLLDELAGEPDLSARERKQSDDIRATLLIREVDEDRRSGEFRGGFLRLEPALKATPDEFALLFALARLHASADQPARALAVYKELALRDPENLAIAEGAALAAIATGQIA